MILSILFHNSLIIKLLCSSARSNQLIRCLTVYNRVFTLVSRVFSEDCKIFPSSKYKTSKAFLSMFLSIPLLLVISVSFYLLNPKAKAQSAVYVSISNKTDRLRFATNESFLTEYCNIRKRKGSKELVKKNTPFYFEYKNTLEQIRNRLLKIEMLFPKASLAQIRDTYYTQIGKGKSEKVSAEELFKNYIKENQSVWSENTKKKFTGTLNHLKAFGVTSFDQIFWAQFKEYFVKKEYSNYSANKYLKAVKQFMRFAQKRGYIERSDSEDLKYLEEIEPFNIALKESEVEKLISLNLTKEPRLDKVRDLFILEILTGQRFSDLPKLLDVKHISETNIQIYQQKTHERVTIPLHPRLKSHIEHIKRKYPKGLPIITNQKFNEYLKEIAQKAGFTKQHSWVTLSGKKKIQHTDFRYNLITSHTGRRTFCTLALKEKINAIEIMKVTGHRSYDQFREYVKVDDEDLEIAFGGFMSKKQKV